MSSREDDSADLSRSSNSCLKQFERSFEISVCFLNINGILNMAKMYCGVVAFHMNNLSNRVVS